jgi:hypothetical protein
MSDQAAALERLLKKLSGVRATLNKDERDLLDEIVENARIATASEEAEVTPHAWKAAEGPSAAATLKITRVESIYEAKVLE